MSTNGNIPCTIPTTDTTNNITLTFHAKSKCLIYVVFSRCFNYYPPLRWLDILDCFIFKRGWGRAGGADRNLNENENHSRSPDENETHSHVSKPEH